MIHSDRTFCAKVVDSDRDLAEVLSNHKWALCRAFENDDFLFLNDGSSEDAPEYAAVKIENVDGLNFTGREVGRIRPLGIEVLKTLQFIQDTRNGRWSQDSAIKLKVEPEWHHSCKLCEFKED